MAVLALLATMPQASAGASAGTPTSASAAASAGSPVAPATVEGPSYAATRTQRRFSWETPQARALPTGDLVWAPAPYRFVAGASVRYIDHEAGDDARSGLSRDQAWRHHPWDVRAAANAAACTGVHAYVFKRGVSYRGALVAKESGRSGEPIRLTSDPSWGEGEAAFLGSEKLAGGWTRGASHPDIPASVRERVWYRDLDFAPRTLWLLRGGAIVRLPLARMPNWTITDPEDIKSGWWSWDYPGKKYFDVFMKNEQGKELVLGIDTKHLTGPRELYVGAIVWSEFGWVDGTPYPSYVQGFDAAQKGIGFEGYLGSARSRKIARHHRYYLEDKPHYLDDPKGEFWFEKKGRGGRLYVLPPDDLDPNTAVFEAGRETTLLHMADREHIAVSGLAFRFTNVAWNLTELPWAEKFALKEHVFPACIRVWGGGTDIAVSHCSFAHVNAAVLMKAVAPHRHLDRVSVTDCDIRDTDHGGITIQEGIQWGHALPDDGGHLHDASILRNRIVRAGQRAPRIGSSNAIDVAGGRLVEIAGNIIDMPWHAGVNVHGAKISGNTRDVPLVRLLIHQNRVVDGIRTGDDCGNIETWQGGPAYVYNNVSGNPGGLRNPSWMDGKDNPNKPGSARFGMAYYLDGAFKNYYFNNIGYGLTKDPWSREGATTMFQEIISYQNTFFNNTAYQFVKGTRRQAPHAGSNKYLGNIWDGIGDWVFWHTTPAKSQAAGNEADAGKKRDRYALETNAFAGNIFHDITGKYGSFKPTGQWHETFEDCRQALRETGAIASELGIVATKPPLRDPARRDFRPADDSAAIDRGAKVFVPWGLYATVAEWHFYPAGNDPTRILDEHWYMTPYYTNRDDYFTKPRFPLKAVNVVAADYVAGPLENWTRGALALNGRDHYAVCENRALTEPFDMTVHFKWDRQRAPETRTIAGPSFKSPQVYDGNFLIEAVFRAESGGPRGVLVEKRFGGSGYALEVEDAGTLLFSIGGCPGGKRASLRSRAALADGRWHHVIAECDRTSGGRLVFYVDGKREAEGAGLDSSTSLENIADLYVGGTPEGRCLRGALEFLRISLGTLADARTDIEELYAWQFDGPFLRDFTGRAPTGQRDAGALEK